MMESVTASVFHGKLPEDASKLRVFLYKMIDTKLFGATILFIILVNTVVLIIQTDEEISVKLGKNHFDYFSACV